jgi:hypothetical protein
MVKRIYTSLTLLVFVYLILSAIYVPLVFDEIYTFFHYVRPTNLTPLNDYTAANNHLLNTSLTYLSYNVFGNYPLVLRLPNVMSFLIFALYVYKIGKDFIKDLLPKWIFYISLLLTVNFVSFFALSRGYGLSFAFMMASIYYTLNLYKEVKGKSLLLSVLFMMLAVLANFSILLFALISLLVLAILVLKNRKQYFAKQNKWYTVYSFVAVGTTLFFVLKTLFIYKEQGQLYWGNLEGFWKTTVYSLYYLILQVKEGSIGLNMFVIACSLIVLGTLFIGGVFKKENFFSFLIILNVAGIIIMAVFLGVNYPVQRIGLHLFVLFIGSYCFSVVKIKNKKVQLILLLPFIALPIFSFFNLNLSTISCWEEDNLPYRFASKVAEFERGKSNILSVYGEGVSGYCWAYQIDKENLNLPTVVASRQNEKRNYDYIIDLKENVKPFIHLYDSLDYNEYSTHYLLKRKKPTNKELILQSDVLKNIEVQANEFTELTRVSVDSLGVSSILIDFNVALKSDVPSFQNWIVVSIDNTETKENLSYNSIKLDWKNKWTSNDIIKQGIYVNDLPKNKKIDVVIYFWNIRKENYTIISAQAKGYKIIEDYTK